MASEKSVFEDGNDTKGAIRVLCVEDEVLDRELIRDALEKETEGFAMTEAADRESFRAFLEEGEFDVVLTDFNILGFESLEVIRAVRKKRPEVPVVVVTGTGSEEIAVKALKFIRSTTPTTVEIRQSIQGESMIMGSPSQVHRILMNLLTNASQAMEDDGGVLEIRTENVLVKPFSPLSAKGLKPGEYLEIKVSDTGEGIVGASPASCMKNVKPGTL